MSVVIGGSTSSTPKPHKKIILIPLDSTGPAVIPILAAISGFISAFISILPIPAIPPLIAASPMSPPSIPMALLKPSIPFAPIAAIVPWLTSAECCVDTTTDLYFPLLNIQLFQSI